MKSKTLNDSFTVNKEETTMDDREMLKNELMKLLDEIPLERLKALYIKALVAKAS